MLDGLGGLTGTESGNLNGTVTSGAPITGSYTVTSKCQGTITYNLNGSPINLNVVFVSGGKSFFAIETDSGTIATTVAHQ